MNDLYLEPDNRSPGKYITFSEQWVHVAIVFTVLLLVYFITTPRTLALEDDGAFVLASYYWGISHPPGYPLYTFLGGLATYIPIGSIAFRVHMLSGVLGAAACVVIWWICRMLIRGPAPAYVAAFAYGFSDIFWSQSIIAEVYTLNVFLFFLLFALCLGYINVGVSAQDKTGRLPKVLMGCAFIYGLGLSNHWPLMVLSTPALVTLLWFKRSIVIRHFFTLFFFVGIGLLPYVWMFVRSQMDPIIGFYGPMSSWEDFWYVISREGYAVTDNDPAAGWFDKLMFGLFLGRSALTQFTLLGAGLACIGFYKQFKQWPLSVSLALILVCLGNSLVLLFLIGFKYNELYQAVFRVYPLLMYGCMAIWVALGYRTFLDWIRSCKPNSLSAAFTSRAFAILIIGVVFTSNIASNYRREYSWTRDYAEIVLGSLKRNSILFLRSDFDLLPISYFHHIEGMRPDVTLYNRLGLILNSRLFYFPHTTVDERQEIVQRFIAETKRPVASIDDQLYSDDDKVVDAWLYVRLKEGDEKSRELDVSNKMVSYFLKITGQDGLSDPFTKYHRTKLIRRYLWLSSQSDEYTRQAKDQNTDFEEWLDVYNHTLQGTVVEPK